MSEIQKLLVDDGLLRLDINGNGLLVFNPTDFNLYERFYALRKELPELEKKYAAEVETVPEEADEDEIIELTGQELGKAKAIDAEVKARLSAVFGAGNDFDKLLGGVNVMALGSNGERVITNLLHALTPYIEKGVAEHTQDEVAAAKLNREQRRAAQHKTVRKQG